MLELCIRGDLNVYYMLKNGGMFQFNLNANVNQISVYLTNGHPSQGTGFSNDALLNKYAPITLLSENMNDVKYIEAQNNRYVPVEEEDDVDIDDDQE